MVKRRTLQVLALIGAGASAGIAYVMRSSISTGGGGFGLDDGACLFFYAVFTIFSFIAFFICLSNCGADDKEGLNCRQNCFIVHLIVQLVLIIGLLTCMLFNGPF